MSMKVDTSKKKFTKAEASYLVARPWMVDDKTRQALERMLTKEESDDEPNENPEPDKKANEKNPPKE